MGHSAANLEGLETQADIPHRNGSIMHLRTRTTRADHGRPTAGPRRHGPVHRRLLTGAWMVVLLVVGTLVVPTGPLATGRAAAASVANDVASVQNLYANDLLARVNAERAARTSPGQPIPSLVMDAGLNSAAQAWADHIASTGVVQDPPLAGCGSSPSSSQLCVMAGNAGDSGAGFWPGDGSDGMESEYMNSAGHRQNMLNAGYDTVGLGVACNGGQAWTVELFGYAYGNLGPVLSRQAAQNAVEGNPVPPGPSVAGVNTGVPVYCPGQVMGPNGQVTSGGGQFPYPYPVPAVAGEPASPPASALGRFVGIAATNGDQGYWLAEADGGVSPHGTAVAYGSMLGKPLSAPIAHIVGTPDGNGYWLVAADGGIFNFGDAGFYGSMGASPLNAPVVDMTPTSDGRGYWLVASDGGIFAFGDAAFHGSMGGVPLNAPVVGMASTPGGNGYWLVARDGGIFAFGEAGFHGSTGGLSLNAPVVGMAPDATGSGYWLVGSDGGIFAFGSAPFQGSAGSLTLQAPVAGMAPDLTTDGYWLVGSDGGVFAYDTPFFGAG
jgi:hypothetical protein